MNPLQEKDIYRRFIIVVGMIVTLSMTAILTAITLTNRNLIYEQAKTEARTLFSSIVMARKWNSQYGGVYVEKTDDMQSNPYLDNPDIIARDGKIYTKKNPALMAREISELAQKEGLFRFRITSLNPANPANRPDAFEETALQSFEQGKKEVFMEERQGKETYFRYMAPLYVEKSCLDCHAKQGYKPGQVRGGISIMFDIHALQGLQRTNTTIVISIGAISIVLLLTLVFFFTNRLIRQVAHAREKIETMAIIDELTGIFNRRHIIERFNKELEHAHRLGKNLGCMMIDIDHFKEVNDTYGHLIGDKILKEAANLIMNSIRTYDIAGRYGGEEFLVILPDTSFENTINLAERIRGNVQENLYKAAGVQLSRPVTISIGITPMRTDDTSADEVLMRADNSLYKAKSEGRNRVSWVQS